MWRSLYPALRAFGLGDYEEKMHESVYAGDVEQAVLLC